MIKYNKRSYKDSGGDFWTVNGEYYYSSPYQASLKAAMIKLNIKRLNQANNTMVEVAIWEAYSILETLSQEELGRFHSWDIDKLRKVSKYWL